MFDKGQKQSSKLSCDSFYLNTDHVSELSESSEGDHTAGQVCSIV